MMASRKSKSPKNRPPKKPRNKPLEVWPQMLRPEPSPQREQLQQALDYMMRKAAPGAAVSKAPCEHKAIYFYDTGRRLGCSDCGRTWVLETSPGSYMADVGLTRFAFIPEGDQRLAAGTPMKPLHPHQRNGKLSG